MRRGPTVLFAYFVLGALGVVGSVVAGNDPLRTTAWLGTTAFASVALSLLIGVALAAGVITGSRALVWRFQWARALHAELRPVTRGVGEAELFLTALGGGLAEELFFRGMLVPIAGVALAAVAFGLLHQVRGEARWGWALSATGLGCADSAACCSVTRSRSRSFRETAPGAYAGICTLGATRLAASSSVLTSSFVSWRTAEMAPSSIPVPSARARSSCTFSTSRRSSSSVI